MHCVPAIPCRRHPPLLDASRSCHSLTAATPTTPSKVKICDFGLSKYSSCSISHSYNPPTKAYTLEYASPERLRAFKRSYQDDIYAYGVLLYFIATSRTPFGDVSATELKQAIIAGVRPDIRAWAAGSSSRSAVEQELVEAYCKLAERCWHQEPAQRPGCDAILSRLSELQHA
jgi:serine/threonine protein kinase